MIKFFSFTIQHVVANDPSVSLAHSHNISALLCKLLLHFRLTPSIKPHPHPFIRLSPPHPPHINLLHPLRVPIFFFPPLSLFSSPSSLSLLNKKKRFMILFIYFCIIFVFLARTFEFLPISNPRDQERM